MIKLLQKSNALGEKYGECKVDFEEKEIENAINILVPNSKYSKTKAIPKFDNEDLLIEICGAIEYLWSLDGIQATYKLRQYFSLIENIDYFFNNITEIMSADYQPSNEDVIKCRMKYVEHILHIYNLSIIRYHLLLPLYINSNLYYILISTYPEPQELWRNITKSTGIG